MNRVEVDSRRVTAAKRPALGFDMNALGGGLRAVRLWAVIALLLSVALGRPAAAHVPEVPEDGRTLETATRIADPGKSWVIYGEIESADDVRYFQLDTESGAGLWLTVMTPAGDDYAPAVVVMGGGLDDPDSYRGTDGQGEAIIPSPDAPPYVDVPVGASVLHYRGTRGDAEYEPFTPGAYYFPVEIDVDLPEAGPYYVAVHGDGRTGPFGLAVGREERFSPGEWTGLSIQLIGSVYPWSGQGWPRILLPGALAAFLGSLAVGRSMRRHPWTPTWFGVAGLAAGLLALFTAGVTTGQMVQALALAGVVPAATLTLVFVALQAGVGAGLIRLGLERSGTHSMGARVAVAALAIGSVLVWAGYLVGPLLAGSAALAPPYSRSRREGGG